MVTNSSMKYTLTLLFLALFVFLGQASADVYVSPEEHRTMARDDLNRRLADVAPEKQVQFVKDLLADIPKERSDLEVKVKLAEQNPNSSPPAYFLRKGFTHIDYREAILKEWLAENEGKATQAPQKSEADPAVPATDPTTDSSDSSRPTPSTGTGGPGTAGSVALILLGSGILLGLRRALR